MLTDSGPAASQRRAGGRQLNIPDCLTFFRKCCVQHFFKDRLVPFGPRLESVLAEYMSEFGRRPGPGPDDAALLSFRSGCPVSAGTISQTFHHLVTSHAAFVPPPGVSPPRPHSLRHSFAVGTLLRWYRSGIDVSERLVHLSTFLGHASLESTAWYLTITPELLEQASHRFERHASPAVGSFGQ